MTSSELPRSIGRYEIVREIGRGAMGIVYEGRDASLMRSVALKCLSLTLSIPEEHRAQFETRFQQEARAAATLQHPCIVVVYEVGTDAATNTPYMALEYLRGRTLDSLLAEGGRPEWKAALRLLGRLAEALHHAHAHGIVHRDIKPANVMILASGDPKIMDFGVAKLEASRLTTQGQVFGSPSYMAPEQALEARADARSDVFALGCILYELLTGRRAFPGRNAAEIVMRLANLEPDPPSRTAQGIPPEVDLVVALALAKDPDQRYPSAGALAEDLEDVVEGRSPRHAVRPPRTPPASAPSAAPAQAPAVGASTQVAGGAGGGLALPKGKRVSLAFLSGPRSGEVYVLERPTVLIGREGAGGGAGVELADGQVSRAHAIVECHGARFVLRDLESSNGTFADGQRVRERELEDRDEFQIGSSRIVLIVADAD
ncbi:MAG: protein kinase [Vicinamibacteria bacterium]